MQQVFWLLRKKWRYRMEAISLHAIEILIAWVSFTQANLDSRDQNLDSTQTDFVHLKAPLLPLQLRHWSVTKFMTGHMTSHMTKFMTKFKTKSWSQTWSVTRSRTTFLKLSIYMM